MDINSEMMEQLHDEVFGLIAAWQDRGLTPDQAVIILTGTAHAMMAGLGFTLNQVTSLLTTGWKNDGKF